MVARSKVNSLGKLKIPLDKSNKKISWQALETEWRKMYPVAWTDFYRFLLGWMPTHYKINSYTERLAEDVIDEINNINDSNTT